MHRRLILLLTVAGLVVAAAGAPASAQSETNGASRTDDGVIYWLRTAGSSGGVGSGADPCEYLVQDWPASMVIYGQWLIEDLHIYVNVSELSPPDGHTEDENYVIVRCPWDGDFDLDFVIIVDIVPVTDPPPPDVMQEAVLRLLRVDPVAPSFSPAATDLQVVGLQSWVWVDDAEFSSIQTPTECIAAACAHAYARPVRLGFDLGDGAGWLWCGEPGSGWAGLAYDPARTYADQVGEPHCYGVYTDAGDGQFTVRTRTVWMVGWDCTGCAEPSGDLGLLAVEAAPIPLAVEDLQAIATPAN